MDRSQTTLNIVILELLSREAQGQVSKHYTVDGSPAQLNLSVGQNKLVLKYGETVLPTSSSNTRRSGRKRLSSSSISSSGIAHRPGGSIN